jgi:hypothetical protein
MPGRLPSKADSARTGSGYQAGAVDDAGIITFSGLSPAVYDTGQGLPARVDRLCVYCSGDWSPDDRLPVTTTPWWSPENALRGFSSVLTIEPNADILCEFYAAPTGGGGPSD